MVNPVTPGGGFKDFVAVVERLVGASCGISYELISRDVSQVNYSSARINTLEDRRRFRLAQWDLICNICVPVYRAFVNAFMVTGGGPVGYEEYLKDIRRYDRHKWIPSGWPWVDPRTEAVANREALATGSTTITEIAGNSGKDLWDVLDERRSECELIREMGFSMNDAGDLVYTGGEAAAEDEVTAESPADEEAIDEEAK
jgi:capsid protein